MWPAGRTEDRGFTLLELLVVLTIMALSATLVFGVNFRERDKAVIRDFGVSLGGFLQLSRSMALTRGVTTRCVLDAMRGQVNCTLVGKSLAIPEGMIVVDGRDEDARDVGEPRVLMEYYMDGSSSGGKIDLQYGDYTASVSIDPLLGETTYRF
jgi:general secretion pathway protein H